MDEAGKATPPEILVPICLGKKVVLVGDHKQLPPVVDEALLKLQDKERMNITKEDLEVSLFEYLERSLSDECKNILDEQYRMNPVIGDLISNLFYEDKLVSRTSREKRPSRLRSMKASPLSGSQQRKIRTEKRRGYPILIAIPVKQNLFLNSCWRSMKNSENSNWKRKQRS